MGLMLWAVCCAEAAAQTREDIRELNFRKDFSQLANEGNLHAQSAGELRLRHRGKYAQANFWYLREAEKDDLSAIDKLARYYHNNKQYEEAARWYRRGAELGQVNHQVEYANLLVEGRGVEVNHREAVAWYEKAASRNYEYALLPLARLYAEGLGTDRDLIKAFALAERAETAFERSSDAPSHVAEARSLLAQIQDQLGPRRIERGKNRGK